MEYITALILTEGSLTDLDQGQCGERSSSPPRDILPRLKSRLVSLRVRLVINWSNLEASLLSMSTPAGLVRLLSLRDISGVLLPSMGENW